MGAGGDDVNLVLSLVFRISLEASAAGEGRDDVNLVLSLVCGLSLGASPMGGRRGWFYRCPFGFDFASPSAPVRFLTARGRLWGPLKPSWSVGSPKWRVC